MDTPRYKTRFVNGYWVTFDSYAWKHVAIHNTRTEAVLDTISRN